MIKPEATENKAKQEGQGDPEEPTDDEGKTQACKHRNDQRMAHRYTQTKGGKKTKTGNQSNLQNKTVNN